MKKLLAVLFLTASLQGYGQSILKMNQPVRYYNNVTFDKSPSVPLSTTNTGAVGLKQMRDSIAAAVISKGSGTVTSVGSGLGLSGGTISTTGTLALDTANATVLSRQRAANTYQPKGNYGTGTVTSVGSGLGLTGGTISTTGTLALDTANATVLSRQRAANTYQTKTSMAGYQLKSDTVPLSYYISGTNGQLAKFRGDTAVIGITTGTDGQVMTLVSGSPAWAAATGGTAPLFAKTTATRTRTAQTLATITDLSLSLAANSTYEVEFNLTLGISNDAAGCGFGINLSNNSGASMNGTLMAPTTAGHIQSSIVDTFDANYAGFMTTQSSYGGAIFKGIVSTGSVAPTLNIQFVKTTSGTITVYAPSYVRAIKLL